MFGAISIVIGSSIGTSWLVLVVVHYYCPPGTAWLVNYY